MVEPDLAVTVAVKPGFDLERSSVLQRGKFCN